MNKPGTMSRLLLLSVFTLAGLIPQSEAFAQALDGEGRDNRLNLYAIYAF